jgi:hypothetical protein
MSVPPVPPPLAHLGQRPFSFYPPLLNVRHNEWIYRRATWSDMLVQNTKTNEEVWVARRYLAEVSRVDAPVMIVGLTKELEYKAGIVLPAERRVIEMPLAVNESPRAPLRQGPPRSAEVVAISLSSRSDSRLGRAVLGGIALGIAGCVLVLSLYRGGVLGSRILYAPITQSDLGLTANDNYDAVVHLLGAPATDRWRTGRDGLEYRILTYPQSGFSIVLMGRNRDDMRYIGALDRNWRPVHAVNNGFPLLRNLRRF